MMANPPVINGAINDNLLCYVSSSRHSLDKEQIIKNVIGYYDGKKILESKEIIFKMFNQHPIQKKKCASHPNPLVADVDDIYELFQKMDNSSRYSPIFGTSDYKAFPPGNFIHRRRHMFPPR